MKKITYITPHFAVTGALAAEDFGEVAGLGFKSVVSNLPDGEAPAHTSAAQEAELARRAGLRFRHIPTTKFDVMSERVVGGMHQALSAFEGPVLAHCASGLRSAAAWAGAAARLQPTNCVLEALQRAGFDLAALRDELQEQNAGRPVGLIPAALDAGCEKT